MMLKRRGRLGGRNSSKNQNANRLVSTLASKTLISAEVEIPTGISPKLEDGYWCFTDGVSLSSKLHPASANLLVSYAEATNKVTFKMDARNFKELSTLVRRVCSIAQVYSSGGVTQRFSIYHDHFPVTHGLELKGLSCKVTVNNFLGFKSPIVLNVDNVLSAESIDPVNFDLKFTDLDARGASYKTFLRIKDNLKSKLSRLKFLDCIYPVDPAEDE